MTPSVDPFYDGVPIETDFERLAQPDPFRPVPDDWIIGTADIVDSTGEIARGRYKTVNVVGASVIAAVVNALDNRAFPYVFAGDGAAFAVPESLENEVRDALATLRRWAEEEFGIALRAAVVPVRAVRDAGRDLRVARFAASAGVDYAMFSGRGLAWAEEQMKQGRNMVDPAPPGARPDLTGLSCRWSNARTRNGCILSLVAEPTDGTPDTAFAELVARVSDLSKGLDRGGHPLPETGPPMRWPPPDTALDAHLSRRDRNLTLQRFFLLAQNLLIWVVFKTGLRLGRFEPGHYARMVSANADFRKIDDGLKMTLDCDPDTREQIEAALEQARASGLIRYGLHVQDEAMVTCFVPSAVEDDHVHFVDGAAGGYTQAAARMVG